MGDRHPRCGLVGCLGEVWSLNPRLRVFQGVEVTGRQRRDRLGAHHHPGVLDHLEHLRDPGVDLAQQPALGRRVAGAERQLAGRRPPDAHLVLDVGGVDAVPCAAEFARLEIEVPLGHDEQRQTLGSWTTDAFRQRAGGSTLLTRPNCFRRTGQHQVHDVLAQVMLRGGDEALDPLEVPGAIRLRDGPSATGAHIRAGVGLGEHHGRRPAPIDHELGDLLVAFGAVRPQHEGEFRSGRIEIDRRIGAHVEFVDRPLDRRRSRLAAQLGRQLQLPTARRHQRRVRPLQRLRKSHRVGRGVEDREIPVDLGERFGELRPGQVVDLGQHRHGGVVVHLGVRAGPQDLVPTQDLEQIEEDVPKVGLVVTHGAPRSAAAKLPAGNVRHATRQ